MMDVPAGSSEEQLIALAGNHDPGGHLEWDNLVRSLQGKSPLVASQQATEHSHGSQARRRNRRRQCSDHNQRRRLTGASTTASASAAASVSTSA